jgi:hypothetical protein
VHPVSFLSFSSHGIFSGDVHAIKAGGSEIERVVVVWMGYPYLFFEAQ